MATMAKEKKREKKRVKEKNELRNVPEVSEPSISISKPKNEIVDNYVENMTGSIESFVDNVNISEINIEASPTTENQDDIATSDLPKIVEENASHSHSSEISQTRSSSSEEIKENTSSKHIETEISKTLRDQHPGGTYEDLNLKMERMAIPTQCTPLTVEDEISLEDPNAYIKDSSLVSEAEEAGNMTIEEDVIPSAPVFEEMSQPESKSVEYIPVKEEVPKAQCMPLEQAIWMFGGEEMEEIRQMSEREEAIVEVGPLTRPDHPLVDLLSTLRSSLICLERERNQLFKSFNEEEQCRASLWKVEKKTVYVTDVCPCGASVQFRGKYDHAEFMMEKLPAARMRLTALLRDVQESYCHHQYSALLAYYQIEDFLSHVVQTNKTEIRESLTLILQALKLSDSAPSVLSKLLERWASMLASELVDARDPRQLLFLLHHLFKQSRSVRWASRAIKLHVGDRMSAARAVAVLGTLLARPALESACECIEDAEEAWEEVDRSGVSGAVGDGTLRERDLIALLYALPLRQIVANILLFTHADISQARESEWRDVTCGRGVLRASCGARGVMTVLLLARDTHPHYHRLHTVLRRIAEKMLKGLAGLHLQNEASYEPKMRRRIPPELEASYTAGLSLFETHDLHRIPATLLTEATARKLCMELVLNLHESSPQQLSSLPIRLPKLSCETRVKIVSEAAVQRGQEHELARFVLEFLMQTGLKKKSVTCAAGCERTARACLPAVLGAHAYLYAIALHLLADINQVETLDPSCVKYIHIEKWRPTSSELLMVLDDWSQRCPALLQPLLTMVDLTAHSGLSLQCQLSLASWLSDWSRTQASCEWRWAVFRRLRLHRAAWSLPLEAPDPEPEPDTADLFATALALMAASWGHSVPLICSHGAAALCRLASARPLDAAHCLSAVLIPMAASPASIALANKFTELFNIMVNSGPSLVQRALGLGGLSGPSLLQTVMLAHLGDGDPADYQLDRRMMLLTWLHALWRPVTSAHSLVDTALLRARDFDAAADFAAKLTQEMTKEQINQWVKQASSAPQAVEYILRSLLLNEQRGTWYDQLLATLQLQRANNVRINVDGALQQLHTGITSDDLVIHLSCTAAMSAPLQHPGHLLLWRLFFTLYLQRPPNCNQDSTPPVGPLFFSGIMKSRTMASIKRRLQETIAYHQNEALSLKTSQDSEIKVDSSPEIVVRPKDAKSNEFLGVLSIADFTEESSESSDSDFSDEDESKNVIVADTSREDDRDSFHMYCYHVAAEKLLREYARWLDEGENVRALPHHAEIARFLPEQALHCAFGRVLSSRRVNVDTSLPLPRAPPPPAPPPPTVFQTVVQGLLTIRDKSTLRRSKANMSSALGDTSVSDAGVLLSHVDKHLKLVERYAGEWRSDVTRITSLDEQLLSLVRSLRVPRDLPPQRVRCANNCKARTLVPKAREWCISTGAEEGIRENRRSCMAAIRRLTKPALPVVRADVALQALARCIKSAATARRVLDRVVRAVGPCGGCLPAHAATLGITQHIAEQWICHNGTLCAELLSRWSAGAETNESSLQQALCGAIVAPRRLPATDWPAVYTALLRCRLPSHVTFSYLSKFEISRWASSAPAESRAALLSELSTAICRWGAEPEQQHHVLLELIGVHTSALLSHSDICAYIARCTRASTARCLPPQHWSVLTSVTSLVSAVPLHELGHLLRELGAAWWECRTAPPPAHAYKLHEAYAPHVAALLCVLQRAFVNAAVALSYTPERVCTYAWSGARESWSPWVQPSPSPPLLTSGNDELLEKFLETLLQTMKDCPGIEEYLLGEVWEWVSNTYLSLASGGSLRDDVTRDHTCSLLRVLQRLPFELPWFRAKHVQTALQICRAPDPEIRSWMSSTLRGFSASAVLTQNEAELAPQLAALLYLFTAPNVSYVEQTLSEACNLPWHRFPEPALDEALERFFIEHYNLALSYHDAPHFRVLVSACELSPCSDVTGTPRMRTTSSARDKRSRGISSWQRAASLPKLRAHASLHARAVLDTITSIAPYLEESPMEVEELLSRAIVIMCIEPAGTEVLPVWQKWVSSAPSRLRLACASAVSSVTSLEPFLALADVTAQAVLAVSECGGWTELRNRWAQCPWSDCGAAVARARLHAAYALADTQPRLLRPALLALLAADINFVENAAIVSVWICLACRVARSCAVTMESVSESCSSARECQAACVAVLTRWAERRSLLTRVMQQAGDTPAALHRVLCSLALCILSNNESSLRGFESACGAVSPAVLGDAATWGRSPAPAMLPALAVRFHPTQEIYFKEEIDLVEKL